MWRNATKFFCAEFRHIHYLFILLHNKNEFAMKKVPDFLFKKRFLNMTVAFITLFSVIFMNIYTPFSTTAWFNLTDTRLLLSTLVFYILAMIFLLWSKSILFDIAQKRQFTIIGLFGYYFAEIFVLSILYTLFSVIPNEQIELSHLLHIFSKSSICISLILIIPYTICFLYGLSKGYSEQLNQKEPDHESNHLINIRDHKNRLKLSLLAETIFYIVSEDNYVKIFYEQNNDIQSAMIRTPSKSLEEVLQAHHIVRCHRSYMVNTEKIQFFNNDRNNMYILLTNRKINPIPVSRTYRELIEQELSKRQ